MNKIEMLEVIMYSSFSGSVPRGRIWMPGVSFAGSINCALK